MTRIVALCAGAIACFICLAIPLAAQAPGPPPAPATDVRASDRPNDAGRAIVVTFRASADDRAGIPRITGYTILRSPADRDSFEQVGFAPRAAPAAEALFEDFSISEDGVAYRYRVKTTGVDGGEALSEISSPARSSEQWFNTMRLNALVATLLFIAFVVTLVSLAKSGRNLFIRRIAGLSAVDEAVGRATEMGKPMLYIPGLSTISDVATIASLNILSQVAKKAAEYDTPLIVPNTDPIVYNVAHEVVKEAYVAVGKPDAFRADSVFFVTTDQMGYAAAVDGIMLREQPATNFFLGMFWAESLILAETGSSTGAIQIAGTDAVTQLPFFITACDYTLLGEELYAASAYLAREPLLLGTLKAQDLSKVIIAVLLLLGTLVTVLFRSDWVIKMLNVG